MLLPTFSATQKGSNNVLHHNEQLFSVSNPLKSPPITWLGVMVKRELSKSSSQSDYFWHLTVDGCLCFFS